MGNVFASRQHRPNTSSSTPKTATPTQSGLTHNTDTQQDIGNLTTPSLVMSLQGIVGNQAVQRLLQRQKATDTPNNSKVDSIQVRMPSGGALQRAVREKHLDFVRMKRKNAHIGLAILKNLGVFVGNGDLYGHWWVEIGDLEADKTWAPTKSYGWWPSQAVNLERTLKGVPGQLNRGAANDPHHGDRAEETFHPTMMVDDKEDYDTVRQRVIGEIDAFAHGFTGSWNWRGPWGKNCHTFQERLKKKVKLHHRKSKHVLRDPKQLATQQQAAQQAADEQAAQQAAQLRETEIVKTVTANRFLEFYIDDQRNGIKQYGMVRAGDNLDLTDSVKNFYNLDYLRVKYGRGWGWVVKSDIDAMASSASNNDNATQDNTQNA